MAYFVGLLSDDWEAMLEKREAIDGVLVELLEAIADSRWRTALSLFEQSASDAETEADPHFTRSRQPAHYARVGLAHPRLIEGASALIAAFHHRVGR